MTDSLLDKFDAYRIAKEALAMAMQHRSSWRGLPGEVAPQLERAMVSVVLNIAEGAGRWTRADQRRHYQIARGSCTEARACLDIAQIMGAPASAIEPVAARLDRVGRMLTALIR